MRECNEMDVLYIGSPVAHHNRRVFSRKITEILAEVANQIDVIGANEPASRDNISWFRSEIPDNTSSFRRYIEFIQTQLESVSIIRRKKYHAVIIRPAIYLFPAAYSRYASLPSATIITQKTIIPLQNILSKLNFYCSHRLIVESENVINEWNAKKFKNKIIEGATFVSEEKYYQVQAFNEREEVVGYLGILDNRKGVNHLLTAVENQMIPNNLEIRIGGSGPLSDHAESMSSVKKKFTYLGFVPDNQLLPFYNDLKLLVLPSKSEGLPNVALEAMACGTPVLATPVGGLPDIIKDGETGFLMPDNDPETIANHVRRAMNFDELHQVSENARLLIEEEYRFNSAVDRYRRILEEEL